jgi:hypothetical protein
MAVVSRGMDEDNSSRAPGQQVDEDETECQIEERSLEASRDRYEAEPDAGG